MTNVPFPMNELWMITYRFGNLDEFRARVS
jgi:hypothetical protein